ncbi:MAG: PIG-L family deacetylase [Planctomycetes bacterium]|nr:PIG-L family deacetylase [Planctomycetota bacterium]
MADHSLRILVMGAHPDDCDIKAAGVAALWKSLGHTIRFVSVTNGESGHHRLKGEELATIRREEASAAGRVLGIQYDVLNNRDGYLEPTLEARFEIIRLIREFHPDLILTHRPNDYHPDHRYTSQLVCDAAYMVTVPPIVPDVPALRDNPVIAYLSDHFIRPYPFSPTIVVDIEPVIEQVVDMLDCHKSQFYDWLAYNHFYEDQLPDNALERRQWLGEMFRQRIAPLAEQHRELIIATYGEEQGPNVKYIEAFEPCEYGDPLTNENRLRLFPFLPR